MMETNSKKRILILAANPKATPKLRLDQEVREITEGLQRSKYRDRFDIHSIWAVRHRDLHRALLDHQPNIVHFCGHGNKEGILAEDELGFGKLFPSKALAELFKLCANDITCVILSACYSAAHANAINKHINYVIGMKKEVEDKSALEFAVGFYDALGAGKPVEEAFQFGRVAIMAATSNVPNHLVPILKRRKSDNNEFNNQEPAEKVNEGSKKGQAKKDDSNNKSKGPTIIANMIGKVQTVDGDITYNYDIKNNYE